MDTAIPARGRDGTAAGHAPFLLAGAAGALVLAIVGLLLRDRIPGVDAWGLDALRVAPASPAEEVLAAISDGLRIGCVAGAAAAIGWLVWRGRRQALVPALGFVALFLVLAASSELLKEVFGRPHPGDPADLSYPSTHVAMVTVAVVIAAAIMGRLAVRWRGRLVLLAVAAVLATAATRVVLGEHHLTDVAGTALGYAGLSLLGIRLLLLMPVPGRHGVPA
jgi:membrane-associated phospholipid phosphatase